jgi:hypothetical protein
MNMKKRARKYKLTEEQEKAIRLLAEGHSSEETAVAVQVDPETLQTWRQTDIAFMAAYNYLIHDQHRVVMRKFADGRARAIERLAELVDHRDSRIALKAVSILMKMEFPQPIGETDPGKLEDSMRLFSGFKF